MQSKINTIILFIIEPSNKYSDEKSGSFLLTKSNSQKQNKIYIKNSYGKIYKNQKSFRVILEAK